MASFPSAKVHRVDRRKLGRGQFPSRPGATVTATGSVDTATLTFSVPVVVQGSINMPLAGRSIVSQTVVSPTVVHILYDGAVSGLTWAFPADAPVRTFQGGGVAAASGTF